MNRARRVLHPLLLCFAVAGCRAADDRRDLEDFVDRWKVLYNSHDLAAFTALYAPNGAYMVPGMIFFTRSAGELRTSLETSWSARPDMRLTALHSIVTERDRIAFVWELALTPPRDPTPKVLRGATFLNLDDGRIVQQLTFTAR